MAESNASTAENAEVHGTKNLLIGIVIAIILGALVGGLAPDFGQKTKILGEIFLNSLKMIVIPLVIFSMIMGITGLGDVRTIGPIGGRTVLYYMVTTALSVIIGVILVNIIQPGANVERGEDVDKATYKIIGEENRTIQILTKEKLRNPKKYNENYMVYLRDQKLKGMIQSATEDTVTVKLWENDTFLFDIDPNPSLRKLNKKEFPSELSGGFKKAKISLSEKISVEIQKKSHKWLITDETNEAQFLIQKKQGKLRIDSKGGDNYYIETKGGVSLPFRRSKDGQLVSSEPKPNLTGSGLIKIDLAIANKLKGKEEKDLLGTLEEVILGNPKSGKEGLIPRNVFNAMVNMDILPLIFFSILIGAALSMLGAPGQIAIDTISSLNDAVMLIVQWIMNIAPIGIFGLIAGRIGTAGGFEKFWPELVAVGKYSITVILGLAVHGFIVLPFILSVFGKRNPVAYAKGLSTALLNAFSTASSSATLPLTMEGVEKENGISNRTASFVLPLGATINMDGTALYEAVAAIFIAQVYGIHMGLPEQIIVVMTATLAAIGAAGIPEAGLVTMVIVLRAVDLPIEGIGLILSVDWLLDRFRTTLNVWGDSIGAGVIETLEGRPPLPDEEQKTENKEEKPKSVSAPKEESKKEDVKKVKKEKPTTAKKEAKKEPQKATKSKGKKKKGKK